MNLISHYATKKEYIQYDPFFLMNTFDPITWAVNRMEIVMTS